MITISHTGHPWLPESVDAVGDVTVISADGREFRGDFTHVNFRFATVKTGPKSSLKIVLPDVTLFTIKDNSEIEMDDFVYDSNLDLHKFVCQMVKGAFRFVTGKIARANPENMHMWMRLSVGGIGVRGTDFTVELNDTETDVYLKTGAISYSYNDLTKPDDHRYSSIDMVPNSRLVICILSAS